MNQEQFNQFVCEFAYQIISANSSLTVQDNLELINTSIQRARYYMPQEIRLMIDDTIIELNKKS